MVSDHNKNKDSESHTGVENNDWGGGKQGLVSRRNFIRKITAHTDDITKNTDGIGQ